MAIKWGNSNVTAVKWGSTNITKVLWGSTQVFPDLVTLFNGGNASSNFTGMNGEIFDSGPTLNEWFCYEASYFVSNYKYWDEPNPYTSKHGNLATFSLTNGIYSKCEGYLYQGSSSGDYMSYNCGRTKFVYKNNKIDFTNRSTIQITLTSSTNAHDGYTPIYVGGITTTASTGSNKFTWCVRSSITKNTTSTASFTIPTANRNANCYFAIILLGNSTDNADYVYGTNTITKITYY